MSSSISDLLSMKDRFLCDKRRKKRRSTRRASEEGRPREAGDDGAVTVGLPARPDRKEDAK
jgi:hypothetical protein